MNEKIRKGTGIILDFLDAKYNERAGLIYIKDYPMIESIDKALFHSDWNWIMPVIQKIFKLNFNEVKGLREYSDKPQTIFDPIEYGFHSECIDVFFSVVKFLEWHNEA